MFEIWLCDGTIYSFNEQFSNKLKFNVESFDEVNALLKIAQKHKYVVVIIPVENEA